MSAEKAVKIAEALRTLGEGLSNLQRAGEGIPAVEKNVIRMRGTLRQLEVQFELLGLTTDEHIKP